ncbi:hypothetical protein [Oryzifoliimicrobium ureilyticus]|uniref:hypothetical protein n=1 Tax=Oryzifoliimicrobium ureilyticus TaxID=3113724 RepID=UPI003076589B
MIFRKGCGLILLSHATAIELHGTILHWNIGLSHLFRSQGKLISLIDAGSKKQAGLAIAS